MNWIIEPEYISCVIIGIIILYSNLFNNHTLSVRTRLFNACLYISLSTIFLNIITIFTIEYADKIPLWLNITINTVFFILSPLIAVSIAIYSLIIIYEHVPNKNGFKLSLFLILSLYVIYFLILLTNSYTGLFFRFDRSFNYIRGPLNRLIYVMFIYDAIICVTNHFIYRKYSCSSFERIIYIAPPVAALITFFQLLSPNTMLSGTATALTLFIYFINFQQQKNNTDHLTGLINREGFYETITNYTKRKTPFRMIIVCLHGFKSINSHFGQKTADLFLKAVGRYIVSIRRDALVCRFSGVEFAIILTETDDKEYNNYVLELINRFDFPWVIEDLKCELHAYFADVSFENHTPDHEELVSFLEFSSHLSNQHNFGHMVHFNENIKELYSRRNHLVELLDYAYKYNLFSLNFQPVFNCNTNNFSGAEALLRLMDGDGSFIPPSEFIPIAEETGLIIDISWMVLEKVCYFLSTHKNLPIDSISINFSIQQFQDENMVDIFLSIIKKYNVPPQKIKIEITERIVAENTAQVFNLMETLRNNGIGFYLDDFGTGYSNLARISNLPFECIKIDRSLVDNLDNENTIQIFKAIIYAIKHSGKKALIEGIETRQQHNNIDKLDLDMIQGYFYSRPLSEQDYINFINNHQ